MTFQFCDQRCLSCDTDSIRACGEGIDGSIRTIRTDVNNVLASLPSASTQSQIGRLYNCAIRFPNLTEENLYGTLIITNPAASGRIMYIDAIFGGNTLVISAEDPLTYRPVVYLSILRDPLPGETAADIFNLNYGFPDDSGMSATFSDSEGTGTTVAIVTQYLGSFSLDIAGRIIVPPGHSFGVEVTAFGLISPPNSNLVSVQLNISWYELNTTL